MQTFSQLASAIGYPQKECLQWRSEVTNLASGIR